MKLGPHTSLILAKKFELMNDRPVIGDQRKRFCAEAVARAFSERC